MKLIKLVRWLLLIGRIEFVFIVVEFTLLAPSAAPLLCSTCQPSRIFLSGNKLVSLNTSLSAYFNTLTRRSVVRQIFLFGSSAVGAETVGSVLSVAPDVFS
ncbi:hypothetical protein D3C71_1275960 [compost metagenome]